MSVSQGVDSAQGEFIFRTLREQDLESWFDFVGSVFPVGRQYFVNHYQNDPNADINGIFVAVHEDRIVATVRVFTRTCFVKGQEQKMGGIGEVSTHPEFRHRGLATALLRMAIQYMNENNFEVSSLHTGAAAPLYAAIGWRNIPQLYTNFDVAADSTADELLNGAFDVRKEHIAANDSLLLQQIATLHEQCCKSFNLTGPLGRSMDYWKRWVTEEEKQYGHWIIRQRGDEAPVAYITAEVKRSMKGFDGICVNVREFVVDADTVSANKKGLLPVVIHVMRSIAAEHSTSTSTATAKQIRIRMPAAAFELFIDQSEAENLVTNMQTETHNGRMYMPLTGGIEETLAGEDIVKNHVFFSADSF